MNQALILRSRPDESFPKNMDCFQVLEIPIPEISDGDLLLRVLFVGIDPVMRVWLSGAKTYIDSVELGQVMPAFGVGECIDSKHKKWKKGQLVFGVLACANYLKVDAGKMMKVPDLLVKGDPLLPLTLSVFGVTGLTALASMNQIPTSSRSSSQDPKVFCVSQAAGATGSTAIQIARHMGYKTLGIVSSPDKVDFIKTLGADKCIAYNQTKIDDQICPRKLTQLIHDNVPEGIDVYFDNAGEEIFDSVIPNLRPNGYVILCGATATYNSWKQRGGLLNLPLMIQKNVKAEGILFLHEKDIMYNAFAEMIQLVNEGVVRHHEEIMLGVENFVEGLRRVFLGENFGKIIVQIDKSLPLPKF